MTRLSLTVAVALAALASVGRADPPPAPNPGPPVVSLPAALRYALENNPTLATQRRQYGVAAARVVIADTYPFNPVLETRVQAARGPEAAGVTNRVPIEALLLWEVEVDHQRQYRRQGAAAALSRAEWEIAAQEQVVAIDVVRAYTAVLYRQEKQRLIDDTLRLNEQLVDDVKRLIALNKLRPADLIVAQTEVADTADQVAAGREALAAARQDLNRALGAAGATFAVEGDLTPPPWSWDAAALAELAASRRADLQARRMAVAEADANLRLAVANRHGNPVVGPAFSYDPSRVGMIGVQVAVPLPVANTRRGEIAQGHAERNLAAAQLLQAEVGVRQELAAALARLDAAERRADQSRGRGLPQLRQAVEDMGKLFLAGEPGVDVLRVIDVRRKLLKARDGYLDALWSVRQARIDVAAATGEPALEAPAQPPPAAPEPPAGGKK